MAEKFRNKYRIPSARLPSWDYSHDGMYFITICTLNRECFFGKIVNREMHLDGIGEITEQQWIKTPEMRPDMNLELDAFVVMPNHFHGIIIIGKNQYNSNNYHRGDAMHCVSTDSTDVTDPTNPIDPTNSADTPEPTHTPQNSTDNPVNIAANQFKPQSKNLASIIRGFKSAVATQVKISGNMNFNWQPRYYEHIIRNNGEFERIKKYVIDNPANWKNDDFYICRG
ncbi:MAG TPA: hypothetical protein DCY25_07205 [Bacteroidales bacterium]|nr:hypothetical protein [Bacteroidales bacterium]